MLPLKYFFTHWIFIAVCGAALCLQTYILLDVPVLSNMLVVVFLSILVCYNLYALVGFWISNPVRLFALIQLKWFQIVLCLLGGIAIIILFLLNRIQWVPFFMVVFFSVIYFILLFVDPISFRKLGILKTLLLPFIWTLATVFLPSMNRHFSTALLMIVGSSRYIFLFMIAVIFDVRDRNSDLLGNKNSLATIASNRTLIVLMMIMLWIHSILIFWGIHQFHHLSHFFILEIMGFLTFVLFLFSLKPRGYYFYHFLIDGLMLLTSISTFIASI